MVIYKDNRWITNSEYPDSDFQGDADYVVPDNSELAYKMQLYYPHIKLITDEDDNLIDIQEYYLIEEFKENKKQEINNACSATIKAGIDYNDEHYDLTDEDQINMLAWSSIAQIGSSVPYHSSGNPCREYTAEEFLGLVSAATQFKTYHLTYCNLLKQQVSNMTDIEEVKSVTYGVTQLNDTYQAIMTQILGGENNDTATEDSNSSQESDTV